MFQVKNSQFADQIIVFIFCISYNYNSQALQSSIMLNKKYPSGCQKRNNKKRIDKLIESQKGAMNKFVLRNETNQNSEQLYITNGEEQPDETENILEENDANLDANQNTESEHPCNIDEQASSFDIYDPRTWNVLDNKSRDILIEKGPKREYNLEFRVNADGRHLASSVIGSG
jgi:hypothetical protein